MSARIAEVGPETVYGLLGDYFADAEVFADVQDQVLHIGADVMATILKRAAGRGEARDRISPMVATLPTDLYRHQVSSPAPRRPKTSSPRSLTTSSSPWSGPDRPRR